MTAEEIRNNYSDPLSQTNVREILKISDFKASWLLKSGYLKCESREIKSKNGVNIRYYVLIDDLIDYINKVESGELVVPFPKRDHNTDKTTDVPTEEVFPKNPPAELKAYLANEWRNLDSQLTRSQVTEILGFNDSTLQRWGRDKKIKESIGSCTVKSSSITTVEKVFIKKSSLIEYLCSDKGIKQLIKAESNIVPPENTDNLKEYFSNLWKDLDESLTYNQVVEITGISLPSVKRLTLGNKIESFKAPCEVKAKDVVFSNVTLIDKDSLIDFLCTDGYYINQKPQQFIDILKKFFKK